MKLVFRKDDVQIFIDPPHKTLGDSIYLKATWTGSPVPHRVYDFAELGQLGIRVNFAQ